MEHTDVTQDAAIQRFEFTVELAWKSIKRFLKSQDIQCRSPKECMMEGFKFGLVEDDKKWIQMFDDRNLASHAYNEKMANTIYSNLSSYLPLFHSLAEKLKLEWTD
jgi:nucleotidyltransferase substrate binding protein (TIGR01987 family)